MVSHEAAPTPRSAALARRARRAAARPGGGGTGAERGLSRRRFSEAERREVLGIAAGRACYPEAVGCDYLMALI
jgi:hypothetical protein